MRVGEIRGPGACGFRLGLGRSGRGADRRQDRAHQQLFGLPRRRRRRNGQGHLSLRQDACEGSAARRHRRYHQARRYQRSGRRQAAGAGTHHPRPGEFHRRIGGFADRRRHRAGRRRSQDALCHHQRRGRGDHAHLALCRALLLHPLAARLSARPMDGEAGLEKGLHRGQRFHSRPRRRSRLHQGLHRGRRADRRRSYFPDQPAGFRRHRPENQGRQARRRPHLGAGRARGDRGDEGGQGPQAARGRHQDRLDRGSGAR